MYSAWAWCVHGARLDVVVDAVLLGAVVPEHLVRVRVKARVKLRVRVRVRARVRVRVRVRVKG